MLPKQNLLGVGITSSTQKEILEYSMEIVEKTDSKAAVFTPNPEILVYAHNHPSFKSSLNNATISLCDGTGLFLASKILETPVKNRFSGVDFMQLLCCELAEKPVTVGFLGGREGVAQLTADCLIKKYPGLKVSYAIEEWNENIAKQKVDVLFVAFGFPKQEEWIAKNLPTIPVKMAVGVGGAFDYICGKVPRAPLFIRKVGLEWLFRLIVQPWRWRRQLALFRFIILVAKERFKKHDS